MRPHLSPSLRSPSRADALLVPHRYLKSDAVRALERIEVLTDAPQTGEVYVVDTADLFAALEGESGNTRSLERVCRHLQIPTQYLHNAGNDAHVSASCAASDNVWADLVFFAYIVHT